MELLKSELTDKPEHKSNKESFSSIVDEIFTICKHDKSNFNHDKLHEIELRVSELKGKESKQDALLIEALRIEKDLDTKISNDLSYISKTRAKLLESLGSEL
jgi:hypothetical protein